MLPGRALARVLSFVGVAGVVSAGLATGAGWAASPTGSVTIDAGQPTSALNSTTQTLHFTTSELLVPGLPTTVTMNRTAVPTDQIVGTSVSVVNVGLPPVSHVTATFDFSLANPNVANGSGYDVEIAQNTVDDQCSSCFHVLGATPTISSPSTATPFMVGEGGSTPIVIGGTNFAKGPYDGTPNAGAVQLKNSTTHVTDPNVTVGPTVDNQGNPAPTPTTATSITVRLQVSGTDSTDYFDDLVVTNSDNKTVTCTACVHVMPRPVITSVAGPVGSSVGLNAQGQQLTLTGTNFAPDSVVTLAPPNGSPSAVIHFTPAAPNGAGTSIVLTDVDTRQAVAGAWVVSVSSLSRHNASAGQSLTVNPAPEATSLVYQGSANDVGQGAQARTVTVGGSGIAAGAHLVFAGLPNSITTSNEVVDTGAQTDAIQLDVPQNATTTSYPVTIVNPDGGTSQPCAVPAAPIPPGGTPTPCPLVIAAGPTISAISPNTVTGPYTGSVVLTGTNFHTGTNNVIVSITPTTGPAYLSNFHGTATGSGATKTITIPASNINVPASTRLSDADVTVTNVDDGGTKTVVGIFHVVNLSLTGVSPNEGTNDAPVTGVSVTGTNFDPAASVLLRRTGLADIPGSVQSVAGDGKSLTADFDLTNVGPGAYQVIVTNPADPDPLRHPGTAANPAVVFTVFAPNPTTTSVAPTALGGGASNEAVTVTGTNFFPGSTVSFDNPAVTLVGSPSITNGGTKITQHVNVASNVSNGTTAVTVTNSAGTSSNTQNVTLDTAPTVVGVDPSNHSPDPFDVTVAGTGFLSNAALHFDNVGVHAGNVQVAPDGTTITAHLTFDAGVVPADAPVSVAVTVINPDHGQATSPGGHGLTLDPEPRITSVVPSSIPAGKGTDVQILGANFLNNAALTAPNGSNITVSNLHFVSANELDATLTVAGGALRGARTLTVDNGEGGTAAKDVSVYVVPGAPQAPAGPTQVVTPGDTSLSIAWLAPVDDGGSAITGYTVTVTEHGTANSTSHSLGSEATSDTFNGLTNGTLYDVSVVAANGAGNGAALTGAATPRTVPSAPSLTVTPADGELDLSWSAPADGGSPITGYTVTLTPQGGSALPSHSLDANTTSDSFTSLTNGTAYDVVLFATNAAGDGAQATDTKTPRTVPSAPSLTVTPVNGELDLSWTAPADGGSGITGYTATLTPHAGGATTTHPLGAGATSDSFTGLTNGTAYDVVLFATNVAGDGAQAQATKTPRTVPAAPSLTVTPANGELDLSWTAPANGGSAITGYTATLTPHAGGATTTHPLGAGATSDSFTGLTNGTAYDVVLFASNAAGPGAHSTDTKTPRTVPSAPSLTVTPANGELDLSWAAPANGGSAITGYTATLTPHAGGATTTHPLAAGATSDAFTGLTNGTLYDVSVVATNAAGNSAAANGSGTPRAVPGAPAAIAVHPGDALLAISWTAPANNGGNAVDKYTVSVTPHAGGATTTFTTPDATSLAHTFTGLTNGTVYDVSVVAHNAAGNGPAAAAAGKPRFASTLSVKDTASHVVDGTKITLSGLLTRSNKTGVAGATVTIFRKFDGRTAARYLTLTTSSTGGWTTTFAPAFNATYYAVYGGSASIVAATSRQVRTTVAPKVTIRSPLNKSTSSSTTTLKISGKVAPNKAGRTVVLYYVTSTGKLVRLASAKLSSTSTYVLSTRLKRGTWHLRVVIGASTGNTSGSSSTLTVKRT